MVCYAISIRITYEWQIKPDDLYPTPKQLFTHQAEHAQQSRCAEAPAELEINPDT